MLFRKTATLKIMFLLIIIGTVLLFSFADPERVFNPKPYVLIYPKYFGGRLNVPDNNPITREGVLLGRMLFYEKSLSKNNALSCAGCHQQKMAFTDGKAFSTGADGSATKRSAMSIANLLWVRNYFWDGRSASLEDQAIFPLTDPHEMGQSLAESVLKLKSTSAYAELFNDAFGSREITEYRIVKAIAQFERTLISADAAYDQYLQGSYTPTEQELRGLNLFMNASEPEKNIRGANCGHCHGTPKLYKELFHNNGLDSIPNDEGRMEFTRQEMDRGRFRVPTLRNIALTAPYMHDGRFKNLQEVLDHYSDHVQPSETLSSFITDSIDQSGKRGLLLSLQEKDDIIAFLNLLTDTDFISNPAFSDPHIKP